MSITNHFKFLHLVGNLFYWIWVWYNVAICKNFENGFRKQWNNVGEYEASMALNVGLSVSARIEMLDSLLRHDRWWTRAELLKEVCNYVSIRQYRICNMLLMPNCTVILLGDKRGLLCLSVLRK